jgi:hypothetical protein
MSVEIIPIKKSSSQPQIYSERLRNHSFNLKNPQIQHEKLGIYPKKISINSLLDLNYIEDNKCIVFKYPQKSVKNIPYLKKVKKNKQYVKIDEVKVVNLKLPFIDKSKAFVKSFDMFKNHEYSSPKLNQINKNKFSDRHSVFKGHFEDIEKNFKRTRNNSPKLFKIQYN